VCAWVCVCVCVCLCGCVWVCVRLRACTLMYIEYTRSLTHTPTHVMHKNQYRFVNSSNILCNMKLIATQMIQILRNPEWNPSGEHFNSKLCFVDPVVLRELDCGGKSCGACESEWMSACEWVCVSMWVCACMCVRAWVYMSVSVRVLSCLCVSAVVIQTCVHTYTYNHRAMNLF